MQLRLIRIDLLILLLVTLIHVKALEELSPVEALTPAPSPTAMPFQQVSSSRLANNEEGFESPEIDGLAAQLDPESRRRQERRVTRRNLRGKTIHFSPIHSETLLAQKLAKDVLHSQETQAKIAELTSLKEGHKEPQKMAKLSEKVFQPIDTPHGKLHPQITLHKRKGHGKHRGHANRKPNKHRKHGRKHRHPKRRLERCPSKKESPKTARKRKSNESISRGRDKRRGLEGKYRSEKPISNYRTKRGDKNLEQTSGENLEPMNIDEEKNLIDGLPNFAPTHRKYRRLPISRQDVKRSHIIAELMQTTTRDPNKKKLGDQGVEYSEYYSDNDDILSPEIRPRSKLDEVAKYFGGQVRSVREAADGNLLDQNYYDLKNDELLQDDDERSKRNDQRSLSVMEDPSNPMEYVDNTYGPEQVHQIVDNDKISPYLTNQNYIPDLGPQYQLLNNSPAEFQALRQQPSPNQFSPDVQATFNQNPPIIDSPLNNVPSNIIPSMADTFDVDPAMNNVQPVAQGQTGLLRNVVLSQLSQPQLGQGNIPRYSISKMPTGQLTSSVASSASSLQGKTVKGVGDIGINVPDSEKLLKLTAATSTVASSSSLDFKPTPSYDTSREISRIVALGTPARGISAAPASPIGNSLASLDSLEISSRLQDIRDQLGAPEVTNFNNKYGAMNVRAADKKEPMALHGVSNKKGKHMDPDSKTTEAQMKTASEDTETKKHGASETSKGGTDELVPISSHTSCSPEPGEKPVVVNDTKAVASKILTEIIDELEELKLENPKNEDKEGLPCRLTGSWVTVRAGVRIDMNVSNHSIQVSLDHLTSPVSTEGLLNVTWNVTGFAPFKRGGPFTLLATNNHTKTLAVFVGACKVCQGIDTIEGSWTVSREPRDCRDFQMSNEIFNEIFRRTRLFSAIKEKQSQHETSTLTTMVTPSGNASTTESTSTTHEVSGSSAKSHNRTTEFIGME